MKQIENTRDKVVKSEAAQERTRQSEKDVLINSSCFYCLFQFAMTEEKKYIGAIRLDGMAYALRKLNVNRK